MSLTLTQYTFFILSFEEKSSVTVSNTEYNLC